MDTQSAASSSETEPGEALINPKELRKQEIKKKLQGLEQKLLGLEQKLQGLQGLEQKLLGLEQKLQGLKPELQRLEQKPRDKSLDAWFDEWTGQYGIAIHMGMSEAEGVQPQKNWWKAMKQVDPFVANYELYRIIELEGQNKTPEVLSLNKTISAFRNYCREQSYTEEVTALTTLAAAYPAPVDSHDNGPDWAMGGSTPLNRRNFKNAAPRP